MLAVDQAATMPKPGRHADDPIVMTSDGFIPSRDNIDEAGRHGVDVINQTRPAA
jgi:AICAR transformylase/IMP cyclohydrolase PurH